MRTTVTLDADVEALLESAMEERGISFKQALNEAVRIGLSSPGAPAARKKFRQQTFHMGVRPGINLDKALSLAGQLEDEEILRKMAARK